MSLEVAKSKEVSCHLGPIIRSYSGELWNSAKGGAGAIFYRISEIH